MSCVRLLILGCAIVVGGCRAQPSLEGAQSSPEAVATAALDAIARNDRTALDRLSLSEREFRERIWAELPASRPARNLTADYVWTDLHLKSRAHLARTLADHGGRRYRLSNVHFAGESTRYGRLEVYRRTELRVVDDHGRQRQLRIFGSIVKAGSGYKIFSFVVD